jgi:hypothetical protein
MQKGALFLPLANPSDTFPDRTKLVSSCNFLAPLAFLLLLLASTIITFASGSSVVAAKKRGASEFDLATEFNNTNTWDGDSTITSLDGCGDEDTFTVSVVVLDHIWLKFDPAPSAGPTCTQVYLFDSQLWADDFGAVYSVGILQKLPANWNRTAEATAAFTSGYVIGNITTLDLIDAVETFDGEYGGAYDIISNSCAGKIIDALTYLNISVNDATFLDWMATKLQTPRVVQMVREGEVELLYPELSRTDILAKSDSELISKLTYWSANETLSAYGESLNFYKAKALAPKAAPKAPTASPKASMAPSSASATPTSTTTQPVSNAPQGSGKASSASNVASASSLALILFATLPLLM